jgi:hypothetical protein
MPKTYEPIASTLLASPALSVTLSSIPSTYTDLVLVVGLFEPTNWGSAVLVLNSDTATNYSSTRVGGDGSTAFSARQTNVSNIYPGQISNGTIFIFNINNYSNTNVFKTIISRGNGTGQVLVASASLWRSTSAINSIAFSNGGGVNLPTGTRVTLYGIKAA